MPVDNSRAVALGKKIRTVFQIPLVRNRKVVTKITLNSIRVVTTHIGNLVTYDVFAGGGYVFIQRGKRANTKFPVKKVGNTFVLVEPLRKWKAAKGLSIPDFLLARSIATNPRRPINLIGQSEKILMRLLDREIQKLGIGEEILRRLTNI